jgi:hypothetical protein
MITTRNRTWTPASPRSPITQRIPRNRVGCGIPCFSSTASRFVLFSGTDVPELPVPTSFEPTMSPEKRGSVWTPGWREGHLSNHGIGVVEHPDPPGTRVCEISLYQPNSNDSRV